MKNLFKLTILFCLLFVSMIYFAGCREDDPKPQLTGDTKQFALASVSNPAISGNITFSKRDDNATLITVQLSGTSSGTSHPAHIHANTAAEGGPILLDLTAIDGASGKSETIVKALNDGSLITYDQLINIDGYVNVHLSSSNLSTLIAQGDIGQNELTSTSKTYTLSAVSNPAISGTAKFTKRVSGETLVSIALTGTTSGVSSPAHIHLNTAAEGGAIAIDLTAIDGATGKSMTNVSKLNSGTAITYDGLLNFNGYINVHQSASNLSTLIAQGDIGKNELTSTSKTYTLSAVSNPAISGTAKFTKRVSGETLVSIALTGTTSGVSSPAHIHLNTAAQGGAIAIDLTSVDGATGKSQTNVSKLNSGTAITYDELLNFNGYINVHQSASNLSTLIAQGDIGKNELTSTSKTYTLSAVSNPAISGTAKFTKRVSGETLVSIALTGTTSGVSSPAHIHLNTAAQGGAIAIDLTSVDGATGKSQTNVSKLNSGTAITYDELLNFNGYINVHQSASNLSTLIAQGDIGQNELTGMSKTYPLNSVSDPSISGSATFAQRKNGTTLITLSLMGTASGGDHPSHLHMNTAAAGGPIVLDLTNVNGATGKSLTQVAKLNDNSAITYTQLIAYNGYINVHLSASNLATLIAQGNIGSNAP
jgi:cell wall assembly regulator SMI1